jgi:hypothetical protein
MSCSPNGKNLFAAVITFCLGVISASILSFEPVQPVVTPRSLHKDVEHLDCIYEGTISEDPFFEILLIRRELDKISNKLKEAKNEQEKAILRERELSLRVRLETLEMRRRLERHEPPTDTSTKLVHREVCYER